MGQKPNGESQIMDKLRSFFKVFGLFFFFKQ